MVGQERWSARRTGLGHPLAAVDGAAVARGEDVVLGHGLEGGLDPHEALLVGREAARPEDGRRARASGPQEQVVGQRPRPTI